MSREPRPDDVSTDPEEARRLELVLLRVRIDDTEEALLDSGVKRRAIGFEEAQQRRVERREGSIGHS